MREQWGYMEKVFKQEETAGAKALRQDCIWNLKYGVTHQRRKMS